MLISVRRANAVAKRREDRAPDNRVLLEALTRYKPFVQVGQAIKRNARIPVMLDVVANIAGQNKDRLQQSGDSGAGDSIFFFLTLHRAVLANNPRILNSDMPRAIRNNPVEEKGVPGAKNCERAND